MLFADVYLRQGIHIGLLAFVLIATGCDEDVVPVLQNDRPFSLYGVLSPDHDSQWVRVYPIEERLNPAIAESLDARFTSTDLQSGEVRAWRLDSVRDIGDQIAHAFWEPFRVRHGHTYQLEVLRSDGTATFVDVRVPGEAELVPRSSTEVTKVVAILDIQGDVPQIFGIEVSYGVRYRYVVFNPLGEPVDTRLTRETISITEGIQKLRTGESWSIRFSMKDGYRAVRSRIEETQVIDAATGIILEDMKIALIAASEEWEPPDDVFDPEILMRPEAMSNVEKGFGFVGAGYLLELEWMPENDVLTDAGFRLP